MKSHQNRNKNRFELLFDDTKADKNTNHREQNEELKGSGYNSKIKSRYIQNNQKDSYSNQNCYNYTDANFHVYKGRNQKKQQDQFNKQQKFSQQKNKKKYKQFKTKDKEDIIEEIQKKGSQNDISCLQHFSSQNKPNNIREQEQTFTKNDKQDPIKSGLNLSSNTQVQINSNQNRKLPKDIRKNYKNEYFYKYPDVHKAYFQQIYEIQKDIDSIKQQIESKYQSQDNLDDLNNELQILKDKKQSIKNNFKYTKTYKRSFLNKNENQYYYKFIDTHQAGTKKALKTVKKRIEKVVNKLKQRTLEMNQKNIHIFVIFCGAGKHNQDGTGFNKQAIFNFIKDETTYPFYYDENDGNILVGLSDY